MREKILAELNRKYLGLSKKLLGLVADKLAPKVTEEGQIEGAITALDNMPFTLQEFANFNQKDGDTRVTEALKKAKTGGEDGDNDDDKDDPKKADPNAALLKRVEELTKTVQGFQAQKSQETLASKFHAVLKEKKIPLQFAKGIALENEDGIDTAVAEAETAFSTLKQELADQGFSSTTPPAGGGPPVKTSEAAADIEAWAKGKTAAAPADASSSKK